jgi:hypothetical protein
MKTNKKYLDKLANKNNFTFKDLKFFRESVNKPKYDQEGNLICISRPVSSRVTYVIGKTLKKASNDVKIRYLANEKNNMAGKFKQPKNWVPTFKISSMKLTHNEYLHGVAVNRLNKWDKKNPSPELQNIDNLSDEKKLIYMNNIEEHNKMRSDVFSKIVTEIMTTEREKSKRYMVLTITKGDSYKLQPKDHTFFFGRYRKRQAAEADYIKYTKEAYKLGDKFLRSELTEFRRGLYCGFKVWHVDQPAAINHTSKIMKPILQTCNIPSKKTAKVLYIPPQKAELKAA